MTLLEREAELAAIRSVLADGGTLMIEGGAGIGKTSLLTAAAQQAADAGHEILRARGSELEADFPFGIVRQLFERRVTEATRQERRGIFVGPAAATRSLLSGAHTDTLANDISYAVLHGLYWLAVNLAAARPLLIAVDDAHWADNASLRWLAYLAPRLGGLPIGLVISLRPAPAPTEAAPLQAIRVEARVVRPGLLSEQATAVMVRRAESGATDNLCHALWTTSGGNPFYLTELLRGENLGPSEGEALAQAPEGVTRHVASRVRRLDAQALRLAQSLAVLGDGCELRHVAALASLEVEPASRLLTALVELEILASAAPPRFLHPIIRAAVEASIGTDERDAAHRAAARMLHAEGGASGRIGAHLMRVQPAAEGWVVDRLLDAAATAVASGAPQAGAELLRRALDEPPSAADRVSVLLEAGRAEALAGQETARLRFEEAKALTTNGQERAAVALELAHAHADFFRWVDAVDVSEAALGDLGEADANLQAKLEAQVVVAGLRDARRASRVMPALERLASLQREGDPTAYLLARGMTLLWIAGRPAEEVRATLEEAFANPGAASENWDTRGPAVWALIFVEGFASAQAVLDAMRAEVERSGTARGLFTTFSTLGLLNLRLGALPEAETAARVVLDVMETADFAPGWPLLATVLADIAIEAGQLEEAESVLLPLFEREPHAGLGTVQPVAALGRLRLAQGRPAEALGQFETARALFSTDAWGLPMRDNGFLHARSGAAQALLGLGERERARELADQELAEARAFGASRALGIALRVAGMARRDAGMEFLEESVKVLRSSPAQLELGHSLCELGAALRRSGSRQAARAPLAEALDLAARCGAHPLATRARDELRATGARPRRDWRQGIEALTPSELRIARLAAEGRTNREIAQLLYVSPKTVEGHLARAYGKLQISGRPELAQGLGGEKTRVPSL